jgi:long-chain acyl-CoA synthetase
MILLGQDKRELGALVFPDADALQAWGAAGNGSASNGSGGGGGASAAAVEQLLAAEVARLNAARPEFHTEDRIAHIKVRGWGGGCGGRFVGAGACSCLRRCVPACW